MPGEVTVEAVRAGLRHVIDDSTYRRRARLMADEIAAMPAPGDVAAGLRGPA
jgi:UDP:flavonoid glycosyltransferase YjiC (YdhE family)